MYCTRQTHVVAVIMAMTVNLGGQNIYAASQKISKEEVSYVKL